MEALALKYRPSTFDDVTGQIYTVKSLKNAIHSNLIAHAYIFFGSRGVGKTSIARILARSLNCIKGPTTSPCGECSNCSEILTGNSPDVIEMDAASNRGIDHIRELRDNTKFSPMKSRYKIYIIDEVHMLTRESFNALLKTLEEPPSHVLFILATTEKHKIPETILSRCQNFLFRKFTYTEVIERLKIILKQEAINFEEEALLPIAQKSEGSMRDAISFVDQALAYSANKKIILQEVQLVLGILPFKRYCEILFAIREKKLNEVLIIIEQTHEEGYPLKQFLWDILDFIKNAYLIKTQVIHDKNSLLSESDYEILYQETTLWDQEMLNETFQDFYKLYSDVSALNAASESEIRISLEMAIVGLFQKFTLPSVSQLTKKMVDLKKAIETEKNLKM